jgi:hypothetical protein
MRRLAATAAAVALGLVCPASADTRVEITSESARPDTGPFTPTIWLGSPTEEARIARARLAVTPGVDETVAKLTFVIESSSIARQVESSLEIPHEAQVVGLALTLGDGPKVTGTALPVAEARERYYGLLGDRRDPALLEYEQTKRGTDRMLLHVFPVRERTPATVELTIVLPPSRGLTIASSQLIDSLAISVAGKAMPTTRFHAPRTIDISAPTRAPAAIGGKSRRAVDEETAMFVGEPPGATPTVRIGNVFGCGFGHAVHTVSVTTGTIRKEVERHRAQLRYCYSRALQQRQQLEGSVLLSFLVGRDGSVTAASVDGDLDSDEVKECMRAQVAQWRFHEQGAPVQVRYPLQLVRPAYD